THPAITTCLTIPVTNNATIGHVHDTTISLIGIFFTPSPNSTSPPETLVTIRYFPEGDGFDEPFSI
ncbi:hypothetical protein, partial [Klebsiella grimontii]